MHNDASLAAILVPQPHRDTDWEPEHQVKTQCQASAPGTQGDGENASVGH